MGDSTLNIFGFHLSAHSNIAILVKVYLLPHLAAWLLAPLLIVLGIAVIWATREMSREEQHVEREGAEMPLDAERVTTSDAE